MINSLIKIAIFTAAVVAAGILVYNIVRYGSGGPPAKVPEGGGLPYVLPDSPDKPAPPATGTDPSPEKPKAPPKPKRYFTGFHADGVLEEARGLADSPNAYWWLNSGGLLSVQGEKMKTNFGDLPPDSRWRRAYALSNPRDTDNGSHPQNIFRLVTKGEWRDFQQTVYFTVRKDNLSKSPYRDASNGILLFNRYQDGDNLYYAGVRVDGFAVIKKKIEGDYYTLALKKVFSGAYKPDASILPKNKRLGIRTELKNSDDDMAGIKFFIDRNGTGKWELVFDIVDSGDNYGEAPFLSEGHAGIRSDFMDVEFDNYRMVRI